MPPPAHAAQGARAGPNRSATCCCAPPQNIPDIGQVCRLFGIIERTPRRQVEAEGTSYNELVDEVRRFLADELLHAGLPVESVAEHLGFSEAASLIRAYKR